MSVTARLVIGIDVGGTKALAGLVNENLEIIATTKRATQGADASRLIDLLTEEVEELRAQASGEVVGIGLGIPVLLDKEGRAAQTVNLPLEGGTPIGAALAERTGLVVASDNDANCAVIAEHRAGAAKGLDHVVLLTVGTGVGGGVIVGGRPLRGAHGMGAELGHIVIRAGGRPCIGSCPNHGCLEAEASGSALVREATELAQANPGSALGQALASGTLDGPKVTALAESGDPLASAALNTIARSLGVGMSSLANIFDPDVILIGGGVSAAGELLAGPARAEFEARAMPPIVKRTEVRLAQFGSEAGLLGAAILALDAVDGSPNVGPVAYPGSTTAPA
ncbi:MAG: ROK family protein [Solirubrobacteraceae bacterium]|nr:ROK family protein [Solirubrobacteraceae bacterium]